MSYLPTTTDTGHIKMLSWLLLLSKLNVSMQYFTFEVDTESQNLCDISTPFGLYKYKCLPMGIKQSSDVAQEVMENH